MNKDLINGYKNGCNICHTTPILPLSILYVYLPPLLEALVELFVVDLVEVVLVDVLGLLDLIDDLELLDGVKLLLVEVLDVLLVALLLRAGAVALLVYVFALLRVALLEALVAALLVDFLNLAESALLG